MTMGCALQAARASGFTLLELMVVMLIALAMLGLAVPRFAAVLPGVELKAAARDTASALRYARTRSIASRTSVAVVFDLESGTYRLEGATVDGRERTLGNGVELRLVTGRSEVREASVGAIRFFPDGSSTGGRVSLWSGERSFDVDVQWLTGRVTILEY